MKFRTDRIITLLLSALIQDRLLTRKGNRIPILMYHSIADQSESANPYYQTCTRPAVFKQHVQYLKSNGYRALSLRQACEILMHGNQDPHSRNVVITFDDGFKNFYTEAAPVLKSCGYTATVFLASGYMMENRNGLFKDKPCLSWCEVRELAGQGFSFGSHTVNHPVLKTLKAEEIQKELKYSKMDIEDKTGNAVDLFSYPYAFPDNLRAYTQFITKTLRQCGYKIGVTTRIGCSSKKDAPYLLKRIPVNSWDDSRFFKAKLQGAYNWLHRPQYFYKILKSYVKL